MDEAVCCGESSKRSDNPLPWQKKQSKLTPGRMAQAMGGVLAAIGTPAVEPKTRGNCPGWTTGNPRACRIRYPTLKKKGRR